MLLYVKKSLSIFILLLIGLNCFTQPHYVLDTIYIPGQSVYKVSSSYEGAVWFIGSDQKSIYQIDMNGKVFDRTSEFNNQISSLYTDIVAISRNEVVVGTLTDFAYHYKNGTFRHINQSAGLQNNEYRVNTLWFYSEKVEDFGEVVSEYTRFGIATNGWAYTSYSLEDRLTAINAADSRFLYNGKYPMYTKLTNGITSVRLILDGYTGLGELDTLTYGHVLCGNVMYYSSNPGAISSSYIGTERGYIAKNSWPEYRYLQSQAVYSICLDEGYIIIGADSGIYYAPGAGDPSKLDFGLPIHKVYDLENKNGTIYAATDYGLIRFFDSGCNNFRIDFDQDKMYVNTDIEEELILYPKTGFGSKIYYWDFADGNYADSLYAVHKYTTPGNYRISLISSNGYCTDTTYSIVTAYSNSMVDSFKLIMQNNYPFDGTSIREGTINIADANGDLIQEIYIPALGLFHVSDSTSLDLINNESVKGYYNSIWADLNNDGLNEIISGSNVLKNNGNFNFELINIGNDVTQFYDESEGCLLDYDNNGYLDIALGDERKFIIFLNQGDFTFTTLSDVFEDEKYIKGIGWFDLNNDNKNDILITKEYSKNKVYYFKNNGYEANESLSISQLNGGKFIAGDFNNDKYLDLYIDDSDSNYLFINSEEGLKRYDLTWLTNETNPLIWDIPVLSYSSSLSDLDNNGFIDFLKLHGDNRNRLFMNAGDLIFYNYSSPYTGLELRIAPSITSADINNDGNCDVLVGQGDNWSTHVYTPHYLLTNTGSTTNSYLKVRCFGTISNLNAIGAKVFVKGIINGKSQWQSRFIECSNVNGSQSGFEIHFGMGDAVMADSLEIIWPSGLRSYFTNLELNRDYNFVEPSICLKGDTNFCANEKPVIKMPYFQSMHYKWLKDDLLIKSDTNVLQVNESGKYKCVMDNGYFSDTTLTLTLTLKEVSKSEIFFENNSSFCPEDSLWINSLNYPEATYTWHSGGIIDTLADEHYYIARNTNPVQQILTNHLNCRDTSDILIPQNYPSPGITGNLNFSYCKGDSVLIYVGNEFQKYLWSTGDTNNFTYAFSETDLKLNVWNEYGCKGEAVFSIKEYPLPYSNLVDTIIEFPSEYITNLFCKEGTYYFWSDSSSECNRIFSSADLGLGKHVYVLTSVDENNCMISDTFTLDIRYNESAGKYFSNFPNPAEDFIQIYFDKYLEEKTTIKIFNLHGELMKIIVLDENIQKYRVGLNEFPNGFYIIRISNSTFTEEHKFQVFN